MVTQQRHVVLHSVTAEPICPQAERVLWHQSLDVTPPRTRPFVHKDILNPIHHMVPCPYYWVLRVRDMPSHHHIILQESTADLTPLPLKWLIGKRSFGRNRGDRHCRWGRLAIDLQKAGSGGVRIYQSLGGIGGVLLPPSSSQSHNIIRLAT